MHPALSIIFFTVVSGAGYGLFMLTAAAGLIDGLISPSLGAQAVLIALIMVTVGLLSSSLHLANPKNAWRAFFRFRTSWLSREAVFAVLFYLPAALYGAAWMMEVNADSFWWLMLSLLVFAGALLTVFSTGMIYACLKTIRQWNTPMTPANYILISLMHGAMLLLCLYSLSPTAETGAIQGLIASALAATFLAALMKVIHYFWIGKPAGPSLNTATGFNRATVRLLDIGHSGDNFLTQEFSFTVSPRRIMLLRIAGFFLSFLIPLFVLAMALAGFWHAIAAAWCFAFSLPGVLIERWLFFAEARHVVNLYHGMQRT